MRRSSKKHQPAAVRAGRKAGSQAGRPLKVDPVQPPRIIRGFCLVAGDYGTRWSITGLWTPSNQSISRRSSPTPTPPTQNMPPYTFRAPTRPSCSQGTSAPRRPHPSKIKKCGRQGGGGLLSEKIAWVMKSWTGRVARQIKAPRIGKKRIIRKTDEKMVSLFFWTYSRKQCFGESNRHPAIKK